MCANRVVWLLLVIASAASILRGQASRVSGAAVEARGKSLCKKFSEGASALPSPPPQCLQKRRTSAASPSILAAVSAAPAESARVVSFPLRNKRLRRAAVSVPASLQTQIQRVPSAAPLFSTEESAGAPAGLLSRASEFRRARSLSTSNFTADDTPSSGDAGENASSLVSGVEARLSRQLLVFGEEQRKLLPAASVLVVGCSGAGVEAAKCLLQSGVGTVLLADPQSVSLEDCAENFAAAEFFESGEGRSRVSGKKFRTQPPLPSRAAVAVSALRRLRAPYARVCEVKLERRQRETPEAWLRRVRSVLGNVGVLVLVDRPLSQVAFFAEQRRRLSDAQLSPLLAVAGWNAGLSGLVAADFGRAFSFLDVDEDAALKALLAKHGGGAELSSAAEGLETGTGTAVAAFDDLLSALRPASPTAAAEKRRRRKRAAGGEPAAKALQEDPPPSLLRTAFFALQEFGERRSSGGADTAACVALLGEMELPRTSPDEEWVARRCAALRRQGPSETPDAEEAAAASRVGRLLARGAKGKTAPMAAAVGALLAQEALKGVTRRFRPLQRPLLVHALDLLTLTKASPPQDAAAPRADEATDSRVDRWVSQRRLLGKTLQRRLQSLNVLVVGVGAVGCELVKNFLLMGVGGGQTDSEQSPPGGAERRSLESNSRVFSALRKALFRVSPRVYEQQDRLAAEAGVRGGAITLLDGDIVERSNLNRQFLFDSSAVGFPKVQAAAAAAARLSRGAVVRCLHSRVRNQSRFCATRERRLPAAPPPLWPLVLQLCPEALPRLPPRLLDEQDLLLAALDTVDARLFVDDLCWLLQKPWVEAGTLGLRGHAQAVVPFVTETYAAAAPPAEGEEGGEGLVPLCAVRGVPLSPLHATHWAAELLSSVFRDLGVAALLLVRLLKSAASAEAVDDASEFPRPPEVPTAAPPSPSLASQAEAAERVLGDPLLALRSLASEAGVCDQAQLRRVLLVLRLFLTALREKRAEEPCLRRGDSWTPLQNALSVQQAVEVGLQLFSDLFYASVKALQQRATERCEKDSLGDDESAVAALATPIADCTDHDALSFICATSQLLLRLLSAPPGPSNLQPAPLCRGASPTRRHSLEALVLQLASGRSPPPEAGEGEKGLTRLRALASEVQGAVAALRETAVGAAESLAASVKTLDVDTDCPLQIQMLAAAARLRCRCFHLRPLPTASEVQQLLGRIVPATATATTLAAALACFEVYRLAALDCIGESSEAQPRGGETLQTKRSSAALSSRALASRAASGSVNGGEEGGLDLVLDDGSSRASRLFRARGDCLRSSFFSLSVPFVVQTPPVPTPIAHFPGGLWKGRPFSPWHCMRLTLRRKPSHGSDASRTSCTVTACGSSSDSQSPPLDVRSAENCCTEDERNAALRCSVATLVQLIEERTGCSVSALLCSDAVVFSRATLAATATGARSSSETSGVLFSPAESPPVHLSVGAVLSSILTELRQQRGAPVPQDQQVQWAVLEVVAARSDGKAVQLPPLKVPVAVP